MYMLSKKGMYLRITHSILQLGFYVDSAWVPFPLEKDAI